MPVTLECSYVSCGAWEYVNDDLVFMSELTWPVNHEVKFGPRELRLDFESGKRLTIPYSSIQEILTQIDPIPTITFTLIEAPRFFEKPEPALELMESILLRLANMSLNVDHSWKRLRSLDEEHMDVAGFCLVYRLGLSETFYAQPGHINVTADKIRALSNVREIPPLLHCRTTARQASLASEFQSFLGALSSM